jgi:hypothetical protein
MVVDGEAGPRHAGAAGCAGRKPENVGVKLARLIKVGGVKPDVRDAGDGRARGLLLRSKWKTNGT